MAEYHASLTFTPEVLKETAQLAQYPEQKDTEHSFTKRPVLFISIVLFFAFVTFIIMRDFEWLRETLNHIAIFIAGIMAGMLILVVIWSRMMKAVAKKRETIEVNFIFRDHSIEATQPNLHSTYDWKAISRIVQSDKYWLLLLRSNENAFLPLDAKSMSQELKDFLVNKVKVQEQESFPSS